MKPYTEEMLLFLSEPESQHYARLLLPEIADVLGISVNTVQESISTSLRTLRFYLKKNFMVGTDLILLFVCLGL